MDPQITIESSIFYATLSFLVLIFSVLAQKTRFKVFAVTVALIMIFVAGFRGYTVGRDTLSYIRLYAGFANGLYFEHDPGFGFLCMILLKIYNNYTFLLVFFSTIIYGLIIFRFWELRDKVPFAYSTFTFYSFCFFATMNVTRQYCAVAIVFWGTRYLQKRKYIPFALAVIIAALLFHKSAILSVLYLGIELFSWNDLDIKQKKLLISLFVFGVLLSIFMIPMLNVYIDQYEIYFRTLKLDIGFRVPALLLIYFLSLLFYQKNEKNGDAIHLANEQGSGYFLRCTRIYYVLSCIFGAIGYFFDYMERTGYYFMLFQFVYFGILVKEKYWQNRWVLKAMIYTITLYTLYNSLFVDNGAWGHPYHFVWN